MTKKNAKKDAARARQDNRGGKYQHHLRQGGGASDVNTGTSEPLDTAGMRTSLRHITVGIPLRPPGTPPVNLPFSYAARAGSTGSLAEHVRAISGEAMIFCDSSVFAERYAEVLGSQLLKRPLYLVPHVREELVRFSALSPRSRAEAELKRVVFPGGQFHESLRAYDHRPLGPFQVALAFYLNMLLVRRHALDGPVAEYARRHGRAPTGAARHKLAQRLGRISQRTLQLATKGAAPGVVADEELVVTAVMHAIVTGQPTFVLSADRDVFEQWFKLTGLLYNDFASMLLAKDYLEHPTHYGPRFELSEHKDIDALIGDGGAGSFAFERPGSVDYLFPRARRLCQMVVVYMADKPEALQWTAPCDLVELLAVKDATGGRNTSVFGDNNCYGDLLPPVPDVTLPTGCSYAFVVKDRPFVEGQAGDGRTMRLSTADLHRAVWDIEKMTNAPG